MRTRPLGTSGIEASVIALGTWVMGGWMWGGSDETKAIRAIHAALDAGINLLDTAPIYGFGHSELVVGRAIKQLGAAGRSRVVLATKCGMVCGASAGHGRPMFRSTTAGADENGHIEVSIWNNPDSVRAECERSLRRLQTDYIDLYQTHWQEETTRYEDTMDALLQLKKEGKIRAIGVCNANPAIMDRYRAVGPLDSDQEKYSMLDRKLEGEQLPYCHTRKVSVLGYSPLALGLLTGKVSATRDFPEGDVRRNRPRFAPDNIARVHTLLDSFKPIATRHGCTLGQLVIAWTIEQPGLTHALVGARDEVQALENARAGEVKLSQDELQAMNAAIRTLGAGIV